MPDAVCYIRWEPIAAGHQSGPDRFERDVDLSLSNLNRGRLGRYPRGGQTLVHRPMQKSNKASFRAGLVRSDTDVGARSAGADVSVGSLVVLPICLADCISMRYTFIMLNRGDEKGSLCNDREFQTQRA